MVFIVGDTLRHQPMVVSHMSVLQFRGPITYCVLQWCHPMLTGTQRRMSCSTRMITLYGDHVIKLDSGLRTKVTVLEGFTVKELIPLFIIITGRNEVVAKVIFLHLSVIHSVHRGGVCLSACWDPPGSRHTPAGSRHPPGPDIPPGPQPPWTTPQSRLSPPPDHPPEQTPPPWSRHPPQSRHPPWSRHPPEQTPPSPPKQTPPPQSRHQHTVYERPVRILLECILVDHRIAAPMHS